MLGCPSQIIMVIHHQLILISHIKQKIVNFLWYKINTGTGKVVGGGKFETKWKQDLK